MSFPPPLTTSTKDQAENPILFIFLGASNLARSLDGLKLCIKKCMLPRETFFLHAMGPGRGYVSRGGILNAVYSPILDSGIFEALRKKRIKNQQIVALITDIGNDIMYGASPDKIIGGLQYLYNFLDTFETNIFITSIPVDLENDISELYFNILRKIYFPNSPVSYSQASNNIKSINQFILESSSQRISVIDDMKPFYGIDKIHYSILKSQVAWSHIAEKLTASFNINFAPELKASEVALSMVNNISRILLTDMLGIKKKTNETF
ncbi:MAG: hypothetical protein HN474_07140 [Nitrospina sp.]|nr:hypothetical protein [Nitrospina sp.]